ncbi:MAG TPA: ThuA domain-containing protein [Cyclobacteriaceae bacterium]|nr:ThuA domain-containing protein [Cyclobacteriaceae bacterium]
MKYIKNILLVSTILMVCVTATTRAQSINWKKVNVLIYTKNGKGYVHENIPFAVAGLQKMAKQYGFTTESSDDPSKFTNENLKNYSLIIFCNTNNDVFDNDAQRLAMRQYMEAGGGVVGIHCVIGTERNWDWFKMMIGGSFVWHPTFQKYKVAVMDSQHPSVEGIPTVWEREDECYFLKEMYPGIRPLMAQDLSSLDPKDKEKIAGLKGPYDKYYPATWYQHFDGGNVWVTALGHDKANYDEKIYMQLLYNGIKFVASQSGKLDYTRAYAKTYNEELK